MKARLMRFAVAVAVASLLSSSAVLAQGGPPFDPGGVCAKLIPLKVIVGADVFEFFYTLLCPGV